MSIIIENTKISNVCIIDDDDDARDALEYTVEDANMVAVPQKEPVENLISFLDLCQSSTDAIVSDHHLRKKKNYFPVNGAEFVANCYERNIPSVLVTKYEQPEINEIRRFRHNIPVVLTPGEFFPDSFLKSLEIIINEFKGKYTPERKAWRTLIRVDDVDLNNCYIVIPAWDTNKVISVNRNDIPLHLQALVLPDFRFHAKVNIGTTNENDLFFKEWER